ncbi:hypothetical protein L3Y34_006706 [Caenorhabditis briggsae]|uniref:Serpentine Receptor, class T n=1 Tax=Caenorhabditis briggsae TaxID=6238 RepID=A0AAE9CZV8_CAEBR|nr:hypothetical protein L3Y34_006706 [Caenorhabditis briggsae]
MSLPSPHLTSMDYIFADYDMSLTYFILNGLQLNREYYSCPDDVALRPQAVSRKLWGTYFFFSGFAILVLYLICFIAIATNDLMKTPAYKTMFILGIYDMSSTCVHSIATGVFGYFGITFCDCPRLHFVLGSVGLGSWMGCCITSMTLAVIRITDVCTTLNIRKVFDGHRIYIFIVMFWVYGLYAMFLSKPVTFSPAHMSWFFDPGVGNDPNLYINMAHTINNGIMAFATVIFYGYLAYLALTKPGTSGNFKLSKFQINILLQVFFFCIFHFIGSILYVYMQFVSAPDCLILLSQLCWQFGTGSVCMVYLTLNRSIRKAVAMMILPKILTKVDPGPTLIVMDSRVLEVSQVIN